MLLSTDSLCLSETIDAKAEKLTKDLAAIDEKNAMYKSRIVGLRRDEAKDAADAPKDPAEAGEEIDGDAAPEEEKEAETAGSPQPPPAEANEVRSHLLLRSIDFGA